ARVKSGDCAERAVARQIADHQPWQLRARGVRSRTLAERQRPHASLLEARQQRLELDRRATDHDGELTRGGGLLGMARFHGRSRHFSVGLELDRWVRWSGRAATTARRSILPPSARAARTRWRSG